MKIRFGKAFAAAGITALLSLGGAIAAQATEGTGFANPAFARVGATAVSVPVGHAEFCRTHADECGVNANFVASETLTQAKWQQLLAVNADFNASIIPETDENLYHVEEFWAYPHGYGDCEDYVLAKRRALIRLGWDVSTLLIAVVRQKNGEGHAVLMVRTDRGDLVLDNQQALIKVWDETPYHYVKRQSQFNSAQWVDIDDDRPEIVQASR